MGDQQWPGQDYSASGTGWQAAQVPPAGQVPPTFQQGTPAHYNQVPSGAPKKRRWLTPVILLGILVVVIGGLIAVGLAYISTSRSAAEANVPLSALAGECFAKNGSSQAVSCATEHHFEVYSLFDFPDTDGYPGWFERSSGILVDVCEDDFEAHTGKAYSLLNDLDYVVLIPSEQDWNSGERGGLCVAIQEELRPLPPRP